MYILKQMEHRSAMKIFFEYLKDDCGLLKVMVHHGW